MNPEGKFDWYDGDGIGFEISWEYANDNQGESCIQINKIETRIRNKTVTFEGTEIDQNFEYELPFILLERAEEEWRSR